MNSISKVAHELDTKNFTLKSVISYQWTLLGMTHFSKKLLDTIVRGWKYTKELPLIVVTFFMPLASIVFCQCYKNFHFLSNLHFGYFSFSNFIVGYNRIYDTKILNCPQIQHKKTLKFIIKNCPWTQHRKLPTNLLLEVAHKLKIKIANQLNIKNWSQTQYWS